MSMVPLGGLLSSAAGVSLSQTAGSETERSQKEALSQVRQADSAQHAENSAGIGQADKSQESEDRDADGRRLWETPVNAKKAEADSADGEGDPRQSKDPTGQSGTKLDLSG